MRIHLSDRYVTVLNFALIAAIAYFAALSADDLIAGRLATGSAAEPPTRMARHLVTTNLSRASYSVIAERDVFNSVKQATPAVAPVATNLHIKLLGTSELTAAKPFAIIEDDSSHQQSLYRLGDEIPDAGTLVKVERKRVLINHQGEIVALEISDKAQTMPIPKLAVGRLVETASDINHVLQAYLNMPNGTLRPANALVTGYDFLSDTASEIKGELQHSP